MAFHNTVVMDRPVEHPVQSTRNPTAIKKKEIEAIERACVDIPNRFRLYPTFSTPRFIQSSVLFTGKPDPTSQRVLTSLDLQSMFLSTALTFCETAARAIGRPLCPAALRVNVKLGFNPLSDLVLSSDEIQVRAMSDIFDTLDLTHCSSIEMNEMDFNKFAVLFKAVQVAWERAIERCTLLPFRGLHVEISCSSFYGVENMMPALSNCAPLTSVEFSYRFMEAVNQISTQRVEALFYSMLYNRQKQGLPLALHFQVFDKLTPWLLSALNHGVKLGVLTGLRFIMVSNHVPVDFSELRLGAALLQRTPSKHACLGFDIQFQQKGAGSVIDISKCDIFGLRPSPEKNMVFTPLRRVCMWNVCQHAGNTEPLLGLIESRGPALEKLSLVQAVVPDHDMPLVLRAAFAARVPKVKLIARQHSLELDEQFAKVLLDSFPADVACEKVCNCVPFMHPAVVADMKTKIKLQENRWTPLRSAWVEAVVAGGNAVAQGMKGCSGAAAARRRDRKRAYEQDFAPKKRK